jgi:hypothetical protein
MIAPAVAVPGLVVRAFAGRRTSPRSLGFEPQRAFTAWRKPL